MRRRLLEGLQRALKECDESMVHLVDDEDL